MADTERENPFGFVDTRRTVGDLGNANGSSVAAGTDASNYGSVAGLRARLIAANATYYTASLLNTMTRNDLVYAVRQQDEAAGIR